MKSISAAIVVLAGAVMITASSIFSTAEKYDGREVFGPLLAGSILLTLIAAVTWLCMLRKDK